MRTIFQIFITGFLFSFSIQANEIAGWVITADSTKFQKDQAIFTGKVKVNNKRDGGFEMTCDKFTIVMNGKGVAKSWIATGKMVTYKRETKQGIIQTVKATKGVFDRTTGKTIFSGGPPFMQNGDSQYIDVDSEETSIELASNGNFKVTAPSTRRIQLILPIPLDKEMKDSLNLPLPEELEK